jgi:hypothetical protein
MISASQLAAPPGRKLGENSCQFWVFRQDDEAHLQHRGPAQSISARVMGLSPRPIEGGFVDHAPNRGNNRADVLKQASDREAFLEALGKTQQHSPFRLFGSA